jgi:hypothetical protein
MGHSRVHDGVHAGARRVVTTFCSTRRKRCVRRNGRTKAFLRSALVALDSMVMLPMRNKTLALHVHEYVTSTMSRVLCHEYYDRSQFGQAVSLPRGRSQVWSRLCCCLLAAVGLRKLCRCLMAAACLRISCVHASWPQPVWCRLCRCLLGRSQFW